MKFNILIYFVNSLCNCELNKKITLDYYITIYYNFFKTFKSKKKLYEKPYYVNVKLIRKFASIDFKRKLRKS